MSKFDDVVSFIKKPFAANWAEEGKAKFEEYLSSGDRYQTKTYKKDGKGLIAIRNPGTDIKQGVPYLGLVQPDAAPSGSYDGTSFVLFPSRKGASLITLCVGTEGMGVDAEVLSRPGHARKLGAIAEYLNKKYAHNGKRVAWAKKDPCAIERPLPETLLAEIIDDDEDYESAIGKQSRYNPLVYFVVNTKIISDEGLKSALLMVMDLFVEARGSLCIAACKTGPLGSETFKASYFKFLFPDLTLDAVMAVLKTRKYVIIQGPPGTGKTTTALDVAEKLGKHAKSIQFHPNMTYEQFIGGLFPVPNEGGFGFKFAPRPGILMECAAAAKGMKDGAPYLLHIDEINRADLSRVLGETISLFEPKSKQHRSMVLPFNFGAGYGDCLDIPDNLYVLGTMNTADKSIAPIDIAIRRRFAFLDLYPQISVVEERYNKDNNNLALRAFVRLMEIFVDFATQESFKYMPGHSYFLSTDNEEFKRMLRTELIPLLQEYLDQGLVASMAAEIEDYIQSCRLISNL